MLLAGLFLFTLSACTRASVPLAPLTAIAPQVTPEGGPSAEPAATAEAIDPNPDDYAVVWVEAGEFLPIRETAGIASPMVAQLSARQGSLRLTGESTLLGSSRWVEIMTVSNNRGWVPFANLTELVPPDGFCQDPRPIAVLESFETSIEQADGDALRDLLSPRRGLIVRHDPWNPEVRIPLEQVVGVFDDPVSFEWGTRFGSQTEINGSFADVVVPELMDVFDAPTARACDQVVVGQTGEPVTWPVRYANLNFYSIHRPASKGGNPFNWRTWIVAFEYFEGQPTIALLFQIQPQV